MKHYPASIPFDVLSLIPLGKPDSSLVWYIADTGKEPVPCIRWSWLDGAGTRVGFFSLETGDLISDWSGKR